MRADANRIALVACKAIFAAARPLELEIAGARVTCGVTRLGNEDWPGTEVTALDEAQDGPWPPPVDVDCRWDGGQTTLRLSLDPWDASSSYRGQFGLRVRLRPGNRSLIWTTVPAVIGDTQDGTSLPIPGWFALVKRRQAGSELLQRALKDLVTAAKLPLLSGSKVELFKVELPSGVVLPSPEVAFRHLVHLALLKLDFVDRGPRAGGRGTPLVDLRSALPPNTAPPPAPDDDEPTEAGEEEDYSRASQSTSLSMPLNLILYGPPGTGKTYHLLTELTPQFSGSAGAMQPGSDAASLETLADLPWWQVVALALDDLGGTAKVESLVAHRWLKAKYAAQGIPTKLSPIVWAQLQQHTVETSSVVKYSRRSGLLLFDRHEDGRWFFAVEVPSEVRALRDELRRARTRPDLKRFEMVTFHQAYSYEDFIEGIRPRLVSNDDDVQGVSYTLEDGVFLRAVRAAVRLTGFEGPLDAFCKLPAPERRKLLEAAPRYAVFIDEINRGNVARVFGELITLLEPDKRLGAEREVIVTLPYSRAAFGVPSNLHVIGTMNTADRSVEALDTALRRRFSFKELPPKPDLLSFTIEGDIDPARLLRAINLRLEKLRDRDHCIGHAFLLSIQGDPSLDALKDVFRSAILPLLQEYFFGDWAKIGLVLGRDFVRKRDTGGIDLADFPHEEREALAERAVYELTDVDLLTNKSFQSIYQDVRADD